MRINMVFSCSDTHEFLAHIYHDDDKDGNIIHLVVNKGIDFVEYGFNDPVFEEDKEGRIYVKPNAIIMNP